MYGAKPNRHLSFLILYSAALLILSNCSLIMPVLAPLADLPAPTGPYAVGTRTATWTDSSRKEYFSPEQDYRKLVVQVWYPAVEPANCQPLPYLTDPGLQVPALSRQLRLPAAVIRHLDRVRTHTCESGRPFIRKAGFPVLLFSHGLSGMRYQNTALIEELVSRGYIVFAPDHSFDANISIFDDGTTAGYRAGKRRVLKGNHLENLDLRQLKTRVADLQFILDRLEHDSTAALLQELPCDLSRVGVLGHSLGGTTALTLLAGDDRIAAGLILDGWYIPLADSLLDAGINKPQFNLGQVSWSDPENYQRMDWLMRHSQAPFYKLQLLNTQHTDFTDMPLFTVFSRMIGYTSTPDPVALNSLIRRSGVAFFDVYLSHRLSTDTLRDLLQRETRADSYIFIP